MSKNYLNINLDLKDKKCLVIGGGSVAERKVKMLYDAGADIKILSDEFSNDMLEFLKDKDIDFQKNKFRKMHLDGVFLVVAATSDEKINSKISKDAIERDILVNVVDNKELSNITLTADFNRGNLNIAVSTSGTSPGLSSAIKQRLMDEFGPSYGTFLDILEKLRPYIIDGLPEEGRRDILLKIGSPEVERSLQYGELEKALEITKEALPEELQEILINILEDDGVDLNDRFDNRD